MQADFPSQNVHEIIFNGKRAMLHNWIDNAKETQYKIRPTMDNHARNMNPPVARTRCFFNFGK
ncbi:hypothetical cytosolic protein [Syntrophus aciditrophicus SB]|uniref:Hypothetical cytosolic protein n=1 Tax=Syntrophus aciditrophicus (strain SB) TaxID=56780 RepID=Q2LTP1_SYNAS|nr:hypothetical cytosolic protein [Syntrophus aciditrophicus SB]